MDRGSLLVNPTFCCCFPAISGRDYLALGAQIVPKKEETFQISECEMRGFGYQVSGVREEKQRIQ
jgi:hypothetical protein